MHKMGASQSEVLQEIVSRSYDRYYIELENAQVCDNTKNKYVCNDNNNYCNYSFLDINC